MPREFPRTPDPDEQEYPEPEALARLRANYGRNQQLRDFRRVYGRDPLSDEELEQFVQEFTVEMYNSDTDTMD